MNVNRFLTIGSFTLAVPAFVYIYFPNSKVLLPVAGGTLLICCLLFWLEHCIKRSGSDFINRCMFRFTRTGRYSVEEKRLLYERLDKQSWRNTKRYILKSNSSEFEEFDDRYDWSADSSGSRVTPIDQSHSIHSLSNHDQWTVFTVRFNKRIAKKSTIETGCIIDDLVDVDEKVRPFLSTTIDRKTRLLVMTVKIPAEFCPVNAKLEVYSSPVTDRDRKVETKVLLYNSETQEISATIHYPRKNWKYYICWEYQNA